MRKHQLSQHFLRSPRLALMLIGHTNIKKRDLVIDIGAGSGVITAALAKRCREVWAVEPDPETFASLKRNLRLGGNASHKAKIILKQEDFLKLELPKGPYKIFANPPFHLSSKILHKLIESDNPPEAIYLILQKQLALKLISTDRHYTSQLGQQINQKYQTRIRYPLNPTDFTPPPAVPTVLYEAKLISAQLPNTSAHSPSPTSGQTHPTASCRN
ncbi:methyltransferase [Candidatus Saccharibacteria bacterium]|nr:methyltransferase [Candidatus Saccharibacteria bacterium]